MPIPVYRSTEPHPADRGRAFGRANAAAVANTIHSYRRQFRELGVIDAAMVRQAGQDVGNLLSERWPFLSEEIAGIAAGAGQDEVELLAINARTEVLSNAYALECSTIAAVPPAADGTVLLGQNWDWHPTADASRVVWVVEDAYGRSFATLTEAGILAKIGLNSDGMGCCLNMLRSRHDGGRVGTPIHVLLRLILQCCGDLDEALALLRAEHTSASSCITVGYAGPGAAGAVAFEEAPRGPFELNPDDRGVILHTNNFVTPEGRKVDASLAIANSEVRLGTLDRLVERHGALDLERMIAIFSSHDNEPDMVCRHPDPSIEWLLQGATLSTVVMDLRAGRMLVSDGVPCEGRFEEIDLGVAVA
jgi:isopenicillin-N N-acyltransferase like protein